MRRWFLLLPVLAAVLAAVLAVELRRRQGLRQAQVASATITRPAPELGERAHVLLPDLRGAVVVVPDRPHDPSELQGPDRAHHIGRTRSFAVTTNRLGLRGPEVGPPRPGQPRVLCLGDSVTFGWGVADDEAWPARLSALLDSAEVINAGVPAMKPASIATWAAAHAPALEPDLVLFTRRPDPSRPDPWKDYEQALGRLRASLGGARLGIILPPVSTFDPRGVAAQAEEQRRVARLAAPDPVLDLTDAFRAALPRPGVILEQAGGLQRMLRLPDRAVLVEAPAPPLAPGRPALAAAITAAFEADPDLHEPLFFDGGHPDAEGFVLFAREVAAWIQRERLLPPP